MQRKWRPFFALASVLLAASASAQQVAEKVEEITVTSQRRSERLQDVPIAVSVFTEAQVERLHQRDITELNGRVPNLNIQTQGASPGAPMISLRGVFFQDVEKSFEPGVGVSMDGVYISTSSGQLLHAFDIQQIEVLRGPQGTLFGRNTTGGAISLTRIRPEGELKGKAALTLGSFDRIDGSAMVLFPVTDRLAAKLVIRSENDSGAFDNPDFNRRDGSRHYKTATASLSFRPSDHFDAWLTYDYLLDKSNLPPLIQLYTPNLIALPVPGYFNGAESPCVKSGQCGAVRGLEDNVTHQRSTQPARYELHAATLNATWSLGPLDIVSVTGFRQTDEWFQNQFDATPQPAFTVNRPQRFRQFSEELRVVTRFDGPVNFVAGYYFFDSYYTLEQRSTIDAFYALSNAALLATFGVIPPPGTAILFQGQYTHQTSRSHAIFAQGDYRVTDRLKFTLGGRFTWDHKAINGRLFSTNSRGIEVAQTDAATKQVSFQQFTPKAGADYKLTDEILLYASYSKGFNTGGFNGRAGAPLATLLGPYAPEKVDAYEVGVKTDLWNRRLRLNASAFFNEFTNKQEEIAVNLPGPPFTSTTVLNAASATYKGIEFEATLIPLDGLTLASAVGYLDAEYTDFTAALRARNPLTGAFYAPTDNTVLQLRRAPSWTVALNADYEFPLWSGTAGLGVDYRFIDSFYTDGLNDPRSKVPATGYVGLSARYGTTFRAVEMQLSAFIKNLTDRTPINQFLTNGPGGFITLASQQIGRTFGVELQVKF